MTYYADLPIRTAVKAVLYDGDEIALVAGASGRLNLPGGGVDPGESNELALLRELKEELGIDSEHLRGLEQAGTHEGIVQSNYGRIYIARWAIFVAEMSIPGQELILGSDITRFERVPRDTLLRYSAPHVSDMAQHVIMVTT